MRSSTRECMGFVVALFFVAFSAGVGSSQAAQPLAKFVVEAGEHARQDTPVSVSLAGLPLGFPTDPIRLVEVTEAGQVSVPVQLEAGSPPRLWWILAGRTKAGAIRRFELHRGKDWSEPVIAVAQDDKTLTIHQDPTQILSYNHATVPPPEGQDKLYERSGFIHPLWSPQGSVVTGIHPADHYHHVGIWMPWTKTSFAGKGVDFWNLKKGEGTVRFNRFLSTSSGPVYGGFQAEHDHLAFNTAEGEATVLKEIWDVRAFNVGGPSQGYWLVDFTSTQRCVADMALHLEKYRYGGFGFRGPEAWDGEAAAYLTSEGKTRKDGHTTRARWCDTAGISDGQWKGVTHFSHPSNLRHPEPMRIWPQGKVFFNWAPVQLDDYDMQPGVDQAFRYRLHVHEGRLNQVRTEQLWHDFADPPQVKAEPGSPGQALMLFDGSDLSRHWTTDSGKAVGWKVVDGTMQIVPGTGSIMTRRGFRDFRLHLEFNIDKRAGQPRGQDSGNSGIYIQRRYEVQILNSYGEKPTFNGCGSLYRYQAPDRNVCALPGRWQSYDIVFHGARFDGQTKSRKARITVWHNGVLIHNNLVLENKTGAGRPEGPAPGPILLQDHGNKISFRNIWIVPL